MEDGYDFINIGIDIAFAGCSGSIAPKRGSPPQSLGAWVSNRVRGAKMQICVTQGADRLLPHRVRGDAPAVTNRKISQRSVREILRFETGAVLLTHAPSKDTCEVHHHRHQLHRYLFTSRLIKPHQSPVILFVRFVLVSKRAS